jgi:hypothetical protein
VPSVWQQRLHRNAERELGQHVFEPGPGFHEVGFAGGDHRHQDRGSVAGGFAADKHPVLAADRDGPHGKFGCVVVDRQIAIFEISGHRIPLIERIRGRLAGQTLRKKRLCNKPFLQIVQQWALMFHAQ